MHSHNLTRPCCQQLLLPSFQLSCFCTLRTRSATRLLRHDRRNCSIRLFRAIPSFEECACARHFDATQWRHQLLYAAYPVNTGSAICLALRSGRLALSAPRAHHHSPNHLASLCSSWVFWVFQSYRFGSGREPTDSESSGLLTMASHQSCFLSASYRCCKRCSLCTLSCNHGIVNLSAPNGSTHRFSSQHSNLHGTSNLCRRTGP